MSDSLQHKLDRVRRPRVQITYDVETGGAQEQKELPFVVGVMADLSGQPKEANKPIKERKFTPIDRDNFNSVLEKSAPRVAVQVPNKLTDDKDQMLNAEVTRQASGIAFLNDFWLMMVMTAAAIPLLLLLKPVKSRAAPEIVADH